MKSALSTSAVLRGVLALTLAAAALGCGGDTQRGGEFLRSVEGAVGARGRPRVARRARVTRPVVSQMQHCLQGHFPHDPQCDACVRGRCVAPVSNRRGMDDEVRGADSGFVLGIDLYGPFGADVDGHTYALFGVEVGRTAPIA